MYVPMPNTWTSTDTVRDTTKMYFFFCLFIEDYLRKDNKNIYTAKVGRHKIQWPSIKGPFVDFPGGKVYIIYVDGFGIQNHGFLT